jgi:hypothetical protein
MSQLPGIGGNAPCIAINSGSMPSKSKNGSGSFRTYDDARGAAEIPLKVKVPLDHGPWGPRVLQLVLHLVLQLVLHLDTIIQFHSIHVVIPQARVLSQSIPTRRIGGAARVHRTSL